MPKKTNAVQAAVSIASCKAARWVLRKTGRGGTAIPGLISMRIAGNILSTVSEGMEIVVVTGTNGKTTTCNMIEHALTAAGCDCLLNKSGANMLHGIAADLICNASWTGAPRTHYAVLECDEAALKLLVPYIHPKVIVVTNLFSDQVDRYGGVENTLQEIRAGVEKAPDAVLALNAEDPLSASLALGVPNRTVWYGLEESVGLQGNIDIRDAGVCPRCGGEYTYDYHIYAHLGGFRCAKCGYQRHQADIAVTSILSMDEEGSTVKFRMGGKDQEVKLALPAVYNVYNAAAALAAAEAMKVSLASAAESLSTVSSSFGRLETFDLGGNRIQMILVKNPAGANQAFSYLTGLQKDFAAVLCLNNRTGDGHDISWIKDTDYEKLCQDEHVRKIYVCGDQAQSLSDRLREAGAGDELQQIVPDYPSLLALLENCDVPVFALPNYTAMMELRQELVRRTGKQEFWE